MRALIRRIREWDRRTDTRKNDKLVIAQYAFMLAASLFILGSLLLAGFTVGEGENLYQSTWAGLLSYFAVGLFIGIGISELRKYLKLKKEEKEAKN